MVHRRLRGLLATLPLISVLAIGTSTLKANAKRASFRHASKQGKRMRAAAASQILARAML